MTEPRKHNYTALWTILAVVVLYAGVSCTCWRLRNPDQTEVQALFHIFDALLWR